MGLPCPLVPVLSTGTKIILVPSNFYLSSSSRTETGTGTRTINFLSELESELHKTVKTFVK